MSSKAKVPRGNHQPEIQKGNAAPENRNTGSKPVSEKKNREPVTPKSVSNPVTPPRNDKPESPEAVSQPDIQLISVNGREMKVEDLAKGYERLLKKYTALRSEERKATKRYHRENELKPYQAELIRLQQYLEQNQKRVIVVFEGRDAAGKGGTIRRVTRYMNEKHYRVVALGKPTEHEKTQWFFQRYVAQFPRGGEIVLFDRSWYSRAMVEPVFGFCTKKEYDDFMHGVVGFEKDLVRQDTILIKLYFSVTKEEQKRRFARRKNDPLRQWKLSEVDMQAQDHWDEFTEMKYKMLRQTSTNEAPWIIIRSDNKQKARLNAIKVILNAVPYERLNPKLDYVPDPEIVVSGARELEWMESQRIQSGKFLS
jgi:polyphosphate kinase 2